MVMRTQWDGAYLDGRTPTRHPVQIHLMRESLQVTRPDGSAFWWPYGEIRQTLGFEAGEAVRLERGEGITEALVVADPAFLTSLRQAAPGFAGRFHDPASRRRRMVWSAGAAVGAVALVVALYAWGIPLLARVVAVRVPVSWEESLGRSLVDQLVPAGKRCVEPGRQRILDDLVRRLTGPLASSPYTFRVWVVNDPTVNAFAAPGGFIIILRGLLEQTRSPEELAGVLAHEIQHVLQRHSTRGLIQNASMGILLAALTGDPTGAAAFGLEGARVLGTLQYSRLAEAEADAEGMKLLLAAGVDPGGMIAFFETLEKTRGREPAALKYLSSHPSAEDRIAKLRALAGQGRQPAARLLEGYEWSEMKRICEKPGAAR